MLASEHVRSYLHHPESCLQMIILCGAAHYPAGEIKEDYTTEARTPPGYGQQSSTPTQ